MIDVEQSLGAQELHALESQWQTLLASAQRDGGDVRRLVRRVMEHRHKLFEANANAHAKSDYDDPAAVEAIESNALAIKHCTTLLSDMNMALGRASIPAPE